MRVYTIINKDIQDLSFIPEGSLIYDSSLSQGVIVTNTELLQHNGVALSYNDIVYGVFRNEIGKVNVNTTAPIGTVTVIPFVKKIPLTVSESALIGTNLGAIPFDVEVPTYDVTLSNYTDKFSIVNNEIITIGFMDDFAVRPKYVLELKITDSLDLTRFWTDTITVDVVDDVNANYVILNNGDYVMAGDERVIISAPTVPVTPTPPATTSTIGGGDYPALINSIKTTTSTTLTIAKKVYWSDCSVGTYAYTSYASDYRGIFSELAAANMDNRTFDFQDSLVVNTDEVGDVYFGVGCINLDAFTKNLRIKNMRFYYPNPASAAWGITNSKNHYGIPTSTVYFDNCVFDLRRVTYFHYTNGSAFAYTNCTFLVDHLGVGESQRAYVNLGGIIYDGTNREVLRTSPEGIAIINQMKADMATIGLNPVVSFNPKITLF